MIDIDKETKFKSLKKYWLQGKKILITNKNTLVLKIYQSTSDFSVFIRDFIKFSGNFFIVLVTYLLRFFTNHFLHL